jgi:uncharacterized protein (TIGR03792 family)
MVVEFLTFTVPVDELDSWLTIEREHWTRFLERQEGFVRKEMWRSQDDPTAVHAVIWWETMEHWKSIPDSELDRIIAAMGEHERPATCVAYDVLRLD